MYSNEADSLYVKIRKKVEGEWVSTLFPSEENPIIIKDWTYQADRMGSAPSISCNFMYSECLDGLWDDGCYVEWENNWYYLKQKPFASKQNTDVRYKYDVQFVHRRSVLDTTLMLDVKFDKWANGDFGEYGNRYRTNNSEFSFYGDVAEFVSRIEDCIKFYGLSFYIHINDGIKSDTKEVSINNITITAALQLIYSTYGIPYYWDDIYCYIGYPKPLTTEPFEYGKDNAFLEVNRSPSNDNIVTSLTGVGSSDNIPYYYPNKSEDRDDEANGGVWLTPCSKLMPSIYRKSGGKERFFHAENGKYESHPAFDNLYNESHPRQGFVEHSEIKPSIEGVNNSEGKLLGSIAAVAYDMDDNDNLNGEQFEHSYFYIKLNKFDGDFGFNLFEQGLESGEMTIEMTSGNCAGCSFQVGVSSPRLVDGKYVFDNPVQVDKNGKIVSGNYTEKVIFSKLQEQQQNTVTNEVWIALRKDNSTYGVVMPNATNNYKPKEGDTFVITNIKLPEKYIEAAEAKLDEAIIESLYQSNRNKVAFSVKMSRVYIWEHQKLAYSIDENSLVLVRFNGVDYPMYVSSITRRNSDDVLQEISIELVEDATVSQNAIDAKIADAVKDLGRIAKEDIVGQLSTEFLSKRRADVATGHIVFDKGLTSNSETVLMKVATVGDFQEDNQVGVGSAKGVRISPDGSIVARSLELSDALTVPSIKYNSIEVLSGVRWESAGKGRVKHVVSTDGEQHICTFILDLNDGEIGELVKDDILRGYWHNMGGGNASKNADDRHGNILRAGFQSIYCRVTEVRDVVERKEYDETVYILKDDNYVQQEGDMLLVNGLVTVSARQYDEGSYSPLPQRNSVLSVSGSFSSISPERRNFFVVTTTYRARYEGVSSWEWSNENLMGAWGDLTGFTMIYSNEDGSIYSKTYEGEGFITKNAYVYGELEQFTRFSDRIDVVLSRPDGVVGAANSVRADFVLKSVSGQLITGGYKLGIARQSGNADQDAQWNDGVLQKYPDGIPPALDFTAEDVPENGALFEITATRTVGQSEYITSTSFTLSRQQIAEVLDLVLTITPSINSDSTIADGETARLEANVYDQDGVLVPDCTFAVTRTTDDAEADEAWNSSHSFTDNYILLTAADLGTDNATFKIVASIYEGGLLFRQITAYKTVARVANQALSIELPYASQFCKYDNVSVSITPKLLSGNNDITFKTLDSDWSWSVNTGNAEFDTAWNNSHAKARVLELKNSDLPANWQALSPLAFTVACNYRGTEVRATSDSTRAYKRFRAGDTFFIELNVTMDGSDFTDEDFSLQVVDARGVVFPWEFSRSVNVFTLSFEGTRTEAMQLGKYRISLWYKKGTPNQNVLDFYPAFELVATTEEV